LVRRNLPEAVPPHFTSGVAACPKTYVHAKENVAAFPRSAKQGLLEWIVQAKRPETRSKRIAQTTRLAELNQRANQWLPARRDSARDE
jgi:hypothetical protein